MAWYKHWFNHPLYLELYRHRDEEEAQMAVDLVLSATGLGSGSRILDLGCGNGRHAIGFAQRGIQIHAMDLSAQLLDIAQSEALAAQQSLPLVRADMRRIPYACTFDAVAQLFTAFGYFKTDAENSHVVAEVARIIQPGGWYVLDFLNAPQVIATLVPRTETRSRPLTVIQERTITGDRVEKAITISRSGRVEARFSESVRMYSADELGAMFEANGFTVEHCFGDYRGVPLTENSPRCILVGKRREDV